MNMYASQNNESSPRSFTANFKIQTIIYIMAHTNQTSEIKMYLVAT